MNATHEEWRPVLGYEGAYEVSDQGRVRSLARPTHSGMGRPIRGGILAAALITKRKYPSVTLYRDGIGRPHRIHRLVLETFVGPCPEGMEALHCNDIAADNRLENLRWGTKSENMSDIVRNGNNRNSNKTHCVRGHEFSGSNTAYTQSGQRRCLACERIRAATDRDSVKSNPVALKRKREYQREWMRRKRAGNADMV